MRASLVVFVAAILLVSAAPARAATPPAPLWTSRYDPPVPRSARPFGEAISADGSTLVVVGLAPSDTKNDYVTIAYDARTGAEKWAVRDDGSNNQDSAQAVAIAPDGSSVLVTGGSVGDGNYLTANGDITTIAYDLETGQRLWGRRYNGRSDGWDVGYNVRVTPDSKTVVVFGQSEGDDSRDDWVTIAYDVATGERRWAARHNGTANSSDLVQGHSQLAVTPDGSKAIVTGTATNSDADIDTIAYDIATGRVVWSRTFDRGLEKLILGGNSLALSPDGAVVVVAGTGTRGLTGDDYLTVAYDAVTGRELWNSRFTGRGGHQDAAAGVAVTASTVIVTGSTYSPGTGNDMSTVAYDLTTGEKLWSAGYDPDHNSDYGFAAAATRDGDTVVVVGLTVGFDTQEDYVTIAYDVTTGNRKWIRRYDGPVHKEDQPAYGIVISPDDSAAYVTGSSVIAGTPSDVVTIAYPLI